MSLKEKLQQDWKEALKSGGKFKANIISMARAAVLQVEKTDGEKLDDSNVIEVLSREVKQRREALVEFEKGNRQDLVDKANNEIKILMNYLPQQLTEDEIKSIINDVAKEVGANGMKDMGKVMKSVTPKTKGRADGSLVSKLVKEFLNSK
ncbi:GatB/YqeY domain-containing protein [Clostridium guangxiense]|uniref:GatB/YqeY domain-containing protein n=1 Tax=Clostridium guangxiense TaxID=1662055 RepID=UPI001E4C76BB|nr:GatB/YqeY domain-containing protein [Clostridium guangxiense]MCD2347520.1 GatB/YqeY domain-containing protein [Clostridium guangxiense]